MDDLNAQTTHATSFRQHTAAFGTALKERHHQRKIEAAKRLPALRTAVVHPVGAISLFGAIEAAQAGLIVPELVGPEAV